MNRKVFYSREVERKFVEIFQKMKPDSKKDFSLAIKELADRKITSKEGEYNSFKITMDELLDLKDQIA